MIQETYYGVMENYLPYHFLDDIIKRAFQEKELVGKVGISDRDKKLRDSRIVWLEDKWIFEYVTNLFSQINKNLGWNFSLIGPEPAQFTIYREGHFYGWHQDIRHSIDTDMTRKISMVIPLSDSSDYEGGDLEFYDSLIKPSKTKKNAIVTDERFRQKGNVIVFPSYVFHQVTKVTKGERLSLVIWCQGESWK